MKPTSTLACLFGLACAAAAPTRQLPAQQPLQERTSPLPVVESDAADLELRMTPTVRAVQKTANAVVSIYIQRDGRGGGITEGQGSGVILDANGFVITNWHVVAPVLLYGQGHSVAVKLRDGRTRRARVLSSSANHDLALLQIELQPGEQVQPVEIGRSADLMVGESVIAIGNPQGHANTVTQGVLSATGRSITVQGPDNSPHEYSGLLQTDAAINRGNSGGALLDITGRLIGINNAMAVGAENIGFAIPVDTVREVFERELIGSNSFATAGDTPWLGFDVTTADGKVVVSQVTPGSPAARVGLRSGDVLAQIGGNDVRTPLDYARTMLMAPATAPLPLQVLRNGRTLEFAPVPWTHTQRLISALSGMQVEEITAQQDRPLAMRAAQALLGGRRAWQPLPVVLRVRDVEPGSPAAALQLQADDILLAQSVANYFGGENDAIFTSAASLAQALISRAGRSVRLVVLRGDQDLVGTLDVRPLPRR